MSNEDTRTFAERLGFHYGTKLWPYTEALEVESELKRLREEKALYEQALRSPSGQCFTLPDGDCVGRGCMHDSENERLRDAMDALELIWEKGMSDKDWTAGDAAEVAQAVLLKADKARYDALSQEAPR